MHHLLREQDRRWRPPILIALWLIAGMASADTIRLHRGVEASDRTLRLVDLAKLEGPAAIALGETIVVDWPAQVQRSRVSLGEVRAALDAAGANWALLSLEGPPHCQVQIVEPVEPAAEDAISANVVEIASGEAATANRSVQSVEPSFPTLRREIESRLIAANGRPADELRVTFLGDEPVLDQPIAGPTRLRPSTSATLGAVPIVIKTMGPDGTVAVRHDVIAQVDRRVTGLIATRTLRSDRPLRVEDVEIGELWVDHANAQPLVDLTSVIGLRLRGSVAEGSAIYPEHIERPAVVRRGQLVNVRAVVGGLVVRSVGTALNDASKGEVVRLRRPRSRDTFEAVASGPQEAILAIDDSASRAPTAEALASAPPIDALAAMVERLQQGDRNR